LASLFDRVIASDASEKQIANAQRHERVEYRLAPAENSGIESETVDLIMVAQALHWFDLDRFYAEARRVLKPDGVLTASAYNLLHINPAIDEVVDWYYYEVVGLFWPPERKLVEQFDNLPFPFHEIDPPKFEMTAQWNLDHLVGYLRTWSSTQRFIGAKGSDPVTQIIDELRAAWGAPEQIRNVIWPLTLRIGRKTRNRGPARQQQPSRENT
jgi:SAM-dependent methyltransferase